MWQPSGIQRRLHISTAALFSFTSDETNRFSIEKRFVQTQKGYKWMGLQNAAKSPSSSLHWQPVCWQINCMAWHGTHCHESHGAPSHTKHESFLMQPSARGNKRYAQSTSWMCLCVCLIKCLDDSHWWSDRVPHKEVNNNRTSITNNVNVKGDQSDERAYNMCRFFHIRIWWALRHAESVP